MTENYASVLAVSDDIPVNKAGVTIGKARLNEDGIAVLTVTDKKVARALMELPGAVEAFSVRPIHTERNEQNIDRSTTAKSSSTIPWYHKYRK